MSSRLERGHYSSFSSSFAVYSDGCMFTSLETLNCNQVSAYLNHTIIVSFWRGRRFLHFSLHQHQDLISPIKDIRARFRESEKSID